MRVRLVALGFLVVAFGVMLFWPVMLGHTFLVGDRATAHVAECHLVRSKSSNLSCSGSWRTESGRAGAGRIYGLDAEDAGRDVPVRIGPMGPYGGGFGRSWPLMMTVLPLLLAPPLGLVITRRALGPGQRIAGDLLAAPPDGAELLLVARRYATGAGGEPRLSLRDTGNPPSYRPLDLPGRTPRVRGTSLFESAAGLVRDRTSFAAVLGPAGEPLFVVERRMFREYEAESLLLDPGGTAQVLIRRLDHFPATYTLSLPDGTPAGSVDPAAGAKVGVYTVRDGQGRPVATTAADGRRWVLRIESETPPLLRNVALAFTFDQLTS